MAKHRLEQQTSSIKSARGALVVGGIAIGALAAPAAAQAVAAPVTIPGIGTFETPLHKNQIPQGLKEDAAKKTKKKSHKGHKHSKVRSVPKFKQANSNFGERVLAAAKSRIGMPYSYGSNGPSAFDCSGLVQWSYKQAGKSVPRDGYSQLAGGQTINRSDLRPGDVIIYNGGNHAGIYAGNGKIVHASTEGVPVGYGNAFAMNVSAFKRF